MVDTGASGIGYISRSFAQQERLTLTRLAQPIPIFGFDGKEITHGKITHTVYSKIRYLYHIEKIHLFVTTLGKHAVILGLPWMKKHGAVPDWDAQVIRFTDPLCVREHSLPLTPELWSPPGVDQNRAEILPTKAGYKIGSAGPPHHGTVQRRERRPLSIKRHYDDWKYPFERNLNPKPEPDRTSDPDLEAGVEEPDQPTKLDICLIGATPLARLARRHGHELFAITAADIEKALAPKKHTDPVTKVPAEYHQYLEVFSQPASDQLPGHRSYDHKIVLEKGKEPPYGPLYGMSQNELKVLRKYLQENLGKGFIRASRSPAASPVIFVKKPGGGLRFCVDYRGLNAVTIKNRYPLPLIRETLERLAKAKFYTKLDIIAAFNRLRIAKGDEWMTAFRTRYGLFEYLVMPFGLANAPSTFQHYVNDVLRPYLDVFCTAYIDDILIYSEDLHTHRKHVNLVLEALKDAGLQLDVDKCEFHKTEVLYLGLVITTNGIRMDPKKVEAILGWETPKTVRDVRAFIGFANFYRRFIHGFSDLVSPLLALTRKNVKFSFGSVCQDAFDVLKTRFTTAPVLRHFDPELPCVVEADSSDYVTGGVLSQRDQDSILHPVAFFSKRLNPAECNYEIYDKELLAIIRCFEEWRPELEGAAFPISVLSDHRNLQYFTTTKQLSHRQARWSEYLSRFQFTIEYRPGTQGQKPDALTRRTQDAQAQEDGRAGRNQTLLRPELFRPREPDQAVHVLTETPRTVHEIINAEYENDSFIQEVIQLLRSGIRRSKKISLSDCEFRENRLYYRSRLVIPDNDELKVKLLRHVHDSPMGGHPGRAKTLEVLQRQYYWPLMHETIRRYVKSCHTCSRTKASREKYHGLLKPLPVPERRWSDISVDFIVDLPPSEGNTNIMVVVDRLSKYRHVIGCHDISAPTVARLFLDNVWKYHGLPNSIVSDRGSQFVSAFWDELTKQLKINARLSTAFHPETDGQTEIMNSKVEQYLRAYVNYLQDDWNSMLAMVEFTGNNMVSETTQVSPFFANSGQHPRMGFEPPTTTARPAYQRAQALAANNFVQKMSDLQDFLREEMSWAQAIYENNANQTRSPAPAYQVGDLVMVDARNIKTARPAKKLDWKNLGPFSIQKVVSPYSYRVELPDTMKIWPVFHTSLLRPAPSPELAIPGQIPAPPPPIIVEGETEYEIERIEDSRHNKRRRRFEYLVHWTGYDNPTWEPAEALQDAAARETYHARYPNRPRPPE
jgi:hypothetical protein